MIVSALLASACAWNFPSADRTSSRPATTLAAMGVRDPELAARIERGSYDELVAIRKGDDRMYGMSSGNAKWCAGPVDTSLWAADRVEWARVYRADGYAVVVYDICSNLSFWRAPVETAPIASFVPLLAEPVGPIGYGFGTPVVLNEINNLGALESDFGAAWFPGGFAGYSSIVVTTCECCVPIGVPAVPEPEIWALIGAGLSAIFTFKRKKS